MSNSVSTEKRSGIDTFLVGVTLFLTLLAIIWAAVSPDQFADIMKGAKNSIAHHFGWFFILSVFLFIPILFFLAFGKYRNLKLGKDDDKPEFSTFSWVALLFGCGLGAGYCFWPFGEALWHFYKTPYLAESGSQAA